MKTITTLKGRAIEVLDSYINGNRRFAVKYVSPKYGTLTVEEIEPGNFRSAVHPHGFRCDPDQPALVEMRNAAPGETKRRGDEQRRNNAERVAAAEADWFANKRMTREQYEAKCTEMGRTVRSDAELRPAPADYSGYCPDRERYAAYAAECARAGRKTEQEIAADAARLAEREERKRQAADAAIQAETRLATLPTAQRATLPGPVQIGQRMANGLVVGRVVSTRRPSRWDEDNDNACGADFVCDVELVEATNDGPN